MKCSKMKYVAMVGTSMCLFLGACASTTSSSSSVMLSSSEPTPDAVAMPESVTDKLALLTPEQRSFLRGTEPLRIVASREKLMQELDSRTPEQIALYVSDMMQALDEFAYDPERDMGQIPLNPEASGFNSWKIVRPEALWERRRTPGPFSVSRYIHQWGGIPTFAGAPVAITPADLVAGKVDIAISGIPQSMSSGSRDARNGPETLRAMSGIADSNVHALIDPMAVLNIVDYGDFNVDRMSVERSIGHITEQVTLLAETGAVPFLVGGDHSVMYPTVKAVKTAMGDEELTVVHLGAHYNAEPTRAHRLSDRDAVYRLMDEQIISGENLIQVGLRGPQPTREAFMWMREQGVKYHTMAEIELRGWDSVMNRVIDEAKDSGNPVYISFDVSIFDPSAVSGIGRAVPGGLTVRELQPLLRRLCAETQIAGFELMDLAPMLDFSYVSAMNANAMLNACLTGVAMRKSGLTEENYLDPIAVDHGQD